MPCPLRELPILALDCQATAASPGGQLLEVGWARSSVAAPGPPEVETHLVAPHAPLRLPRRVRELTGLTRRELKDAPSRQHVGARLASVVRDAGEGGPWIGVAHFARFEEPYLRTLLPGGDDLPLELLCTHELARRLLPALPRRGLRAVAGYLGHAVPELRRARHHVAATVLIWRGLVPLLEERGVRDLEALRDWLGKEAPRRAPRSYPMDARIRLDLPDRPGVYRFQRTDGSVLYVGKATSLRQRVNTYFQTARGHGDRTLEMLAQARAVDVTTTRSALEAALLEPDEIKRLRPPYNVALQEKGRRLGYGSWSLRRVALRPDESHPHGPLLLQAPHPPLGALLRLLDNGGGARAADRLRASALGVPPRYAPPLGCFRAGLDLFVGRHGRWWTCRAPLPALRAVAARVRRSGSPPPSLGELGADRAMRDERWTAERVASSLEDVIVRSARSLRRARWLCALSECSVAWTTDSSGGRRRCLVLERGAIAARRDLEEGEEVPLPPGYVLPRGERQEGIGLAAYDRLSAFSRELKALVIAGGRVTLRLGPDAVLGREALGEALRCL